MKLTGTRQAYYCYWGKAAKEEDGETTCHLLSYHSLDVAAVGQALLEQHTRLRKQLAILAGMGEVSFSRWMVFFLALHDLGKFADSFQNLCPDLLERLQHRTSRRSYKERHDTLGYILWNQHVRGVLHNQGLLTGSRQSRRQQTDVAAADFWMRAVTGHHGQPPKMIDPVFRDLFEEPQDVEAATGFVRESAGLLLPEGEVFPSLDVERMKTASWWLAGFTVLCDWLGSGREASSYRMEPIDLRSYWQSNQEWAVAAVQKTGLLSAEPSRTFLLGDCFPGISERMINPTPLQAQAMQLPLGHEPQLFILEDVTGAGKTEAAVLLAHRLMQAGLAAGIYFGLPTMATSNAMYQRIGSIYQRLFAADAEPSLVLAHSARDLSDAFRLSVMDNEGEYRDGALSAAAHCNAWLADNRKKALLAAVGVGTIDQALLAALPSRHQSLRLLGLLGKVLIVDEVHACDAYMHTLLRGLLSAHSAAGGSAILLSATLPRAQRESLVKAFSRGLVSQAVDEECVDSEAYPLLTHLHGRDVDELAVQTRDSVRRWVNVQTTDSEEEVAVIIRDAVKQGQCVCWIRNTVRDARKAWSWLVELLPESHIELFHARYAMSDRLAIEKRVLRHFGADSVPDERHGRVLVATQVVEQSLDLDFDVLISDLAPIDLVIQRAGRLHRHRRDIRGRRIDGPDERSDPVLYLYNPRWTDPPGTRWLRDALPGTAAVYGEMDGQLWLSLRLLREMGGFRMPEDARHLIESVYGEDALDNIPDTLQEAALAEEGGRMGQSSQAQLNLLNIESGYQQEESNIWWDETVTPTRLGEESVTVYLARYGNGVLVPWVGGGRHAWTRSAVAMRKALVKAEGNCQDIPQEVLNAARESLPAKGKWGVMVPLTQLEDGRWHGNVLDGKGDNLPVCYDTVLGIMTVTEVQELSCSCTNSPA